jgi:hypothetical protein
VQLFPAPSLTGETVGLLGCREMSSGRTTREMKTTITKNAIYQSLANQDSYGVQIEGGKFFRWTASKKEAARIAWLNASDGWPTVIKGDENQVIWESE